MIISLQVDCICKYKPSSHERKLDYSGHGGKGRCSEYGVYGSINLLGGSVILLWHGRKKHILQRLQLAFGGHLYFVGGHGGHFDLPPQFLVLMGIGLGVGSGGLFGSLGPGIRESEAALHGYRERGHGDRFPTYLGCLHFLQHDTAAIKINSWSTRSRIFAILKVRNVCSGVKKQQLFLISKQSHFVSLEFKF